MITICFNCLKYFYLSVVESLSVDNHLWETSLTIMISVSLSMVHDCNFKICFQSKVEEINSQLNQEYTLRRSMLLKRLDVTVQSFGWSDRAKVSVLQAS